jgi:hypothetical protein
MGTTPSADRSGMRRRLTTLLSLISVAVSLGVLPGAGADAVTPAAAPLGATPALGPLARTAHGGISERDCYEFNEIVLVPMATLRAKVPARYAPQSWPEDPNLGYVIFADYTCATTIVDGHRAPGRSVTTMGLTILAGRDGRPEAAYFVLWQATDNLLLAASYWRLGLPVRYAPANHDSVAPAGPGTSSIVTTFRGAGTDHRRDAIVTEPPAEPVVEVSSAPFYGTGTLGEVRWVYANRIRPQSTGTFTMAVAAGSVPAELGVPATTSGQTGFLRGGWDSEPAPTGA